MKSYKERPIEKPTKFFHCDVGKIGMSMDATGVWRPCREYLKYGIKESVKEAWEYCQEIVKGRSVEESECKDCELSKICSNCPAKSYLFTGEDTKKVPILCEQARSRLVLRGGGTQ